MFATEAEGDRYQGVPPPLCQANVYVADTANCRIQKFTSDGTFLTKWGSCGSGAGQFVSGPMSVAASGTDIVYVTDYFSSRTQTFTSDGTFLTRWYGGANDIAVDASDDVYVDSYSYVQRFASCP